MLKSVGLLAALLLQAVDTGPAAESRHLRLERPVQVAQSGTTCVALDPQVFAGADSRALEDVRLFDAGGGEVPFALTESSPEAAPVEAARLLNVRRGTEHAVEFDLQMPARAYSAVDLQIDGHDFVGAAEVAGSESLGGPATALGTVTVFDLTARGLARRTELPLAEARFPWLHVRLRLRGLDGKPLDAVTVRGALVPPSREAQTVFRQVERDEHLEHRDGATIGLLLLPAHVPVERISFVVDPAFHGDFLRDVVVRTFVPGKLTAEEELRGEISRTALVPPADLQAPAVNDVELSMAAVLSSNMRQAARVEVRVADGRQGPLPLRAVVLEMRDRRLCFNAVAGTAYTLRYGDPALHAPQYAYAREFNTGGQASVSALGKERKNPRFVPRAAPAGLHEAWGELSWVAVFAAVALLGAIALGHGRHQRRVQ